MKRPVSMANLTTMLAVLSCVQAPAIPAAPPVVVRETKSAKYRRMTEELFLETREDPRFAELSDEQIRTEIAATLECEGYEG